ncbi:hypothetical protein F0562_034758 [Nyssa sinensis]|uniref:SAC3/GANP/THP3 conserved domain-containing protein n=1 Tax=Nyssa sinensis TaxID=561372 RepID=A0A5J5ADG0_9ASTE|nr:hypothetical protein F0562_034758 [Nyssa sinensis]
MAFQGFGKNSGPSAPPKAQPPFGHFPRPPSPTPPLSGPPLQRSPRELEAADRMREPAMAFESNRSVLGPSYLAAGVHRPESLPKWGDGQKSFFQDYNAETHQWPSVVAPRNSGAGVLAKIAQSQDLKRATLPPLLPTERDISRNPQTVIGRPALSPHAWGDQPRLPGSFANLPTQQNQSSVSPYIGTYDTGRNIPTKHADVQVSKRTRSSPLLSANEVSQENSHFAQNDSKRLSLSPPRLATMSNVLFNVPDSQSHRVALPSALSSNGEAAVTKPFNYSVPKRTRSPPLPSADQGTYSVQDSIERELQAKAKRLARFKVELSEPVESTPVIENQKFSANKHDQARVERWKITGEHSADMVGDIPNGSILSDYEAQESSSIITGLCPDMCPDSERAERERKGDLDQYERLDGDRNQSSRSLAVKKYNRTAEREANLIRPMPVLQTTIDYLINLLDQPYDDHFLGLYNFLWDRMRAIRMDLRMQHIFNIGAITMLEQMIRLHIIAMHELCEYTKGEGFSGGI